MRILMIGAALALPRVPLADREPKDGITLAVCLQSTFATLSANSRRANPQ